MEDPQFTKGMKVEACSDEEDLRGVWFTATVLRPESKKNQVYVEYHTLKVSEKGTKPLREFVDLVNLRPVPPRELNRSFDASDEVDAYYNDAWWEGVVIRVVEKERYLVYFRPGQEELEFGESDLRIHREWVRGSWVPPMEENAEQMMEVDQLPHKQKKQDNSTGLKADQNKMPYSKLKVVFKEEMLVEVSSDDEGFVGAWFSAKIIKAVGENKFLVEYETLRTEDESAPLTEEVDVLHIRPPPPPETPPTDTTLSRFEEVDAMYNDAWWVGVISKVVSESRYYVYFRENNEEIEFDRCQLRLHQDWINGKWVRASVALMSCDI